MKKKILIIGGAGFLGKNLCKYFFKAGYEVYCFDLEFPELDEKINLIKGDFFNENDLKKAVFEKDCIIHAISTVNPGNSNTLFLKGYQQDFIQTVKLCELLVHSKSKMIFISSGGTVYGNHSSQPIGEEVLPRPINHYGNIKLCIENAMRTFNYQMDTDFIIARVSNPYGIGQDFYKGVGFIDAALKHAINNIPVEIWGDGNNIRDYIYINDFCEMIGKLVEYSGYEDTFNISSGIGASQNRVIEIINEMGFFPEVIYKEKRSVDARLIILKNEKIKKIWKKEPMSLEKGIKLYCQYLNENRNPL